MITWCASVNLDVLRGFEPDVSQSSRSLTAYRFVRSLTRPGWGTGSAPHYERQLSVLESGSLASFLLFLKILPQCRDHAVDSLDLFNRDSSGNAVDPWGLHAQCRVVRQLSFVGQGDQLRPTM